MTITTYEDGGWFRVPAPREAHAQDTPITTEDDDGSLEKVLLHLSLLVPPAENPPPSV
jgi:hypothetical protein